MPPAERVRLVKLAGEQRYLARSRTVEPGAYFELRISPSGHVRCTCPGFGYRGRCAHAEALHLRLGVQPVDDVFTWIRWNHA